jgi:predicted SAM-dependent methyltransferase
MNRFIKSLFPSFLIELRRSYLRKRKGGGKLILNEIDELISKNEKVYIEIGSGPKKGQNGWVTLDILPGCDIQMDLLKKLPFPDNSVDLIYSSHFLEHFQTSEIKSILNECFRILKSEGKISTCVPDASIYINAYVRSEELDQSFWIRYLPAADINSKIDYINYIGHMNGEHKHLFDLENLMAIHKACGFQSTKPRQFDSSLDIKERDYESIYVECIK